jgi:hypothetical protein
LAIGLGSRDLVSRSLESHVERSNERTPITHNASGPAPVETIRHF